MIHELMTVDTCHSCCMTVPVPCETQSLARADTRAAAAHEQYSPMFPTPSEAGYANYASLLPGLAVRRLLPQHLRADAHKPRANEVNKVDTGHRPGYHPGLVRLQTSCKSDRLFLISASTADCAHPPGTQ